MERYACTYTNQEDMVRCIQEETEVRFQLAHSAPITQTSLARKLGYLSDTEVAAQILDGTYDIPDEVDDATVVLLEEIARLGLQLVNGKGEKFVVTPEDFQRYWQGVRERTSSSISKVHFGHYIAATKSDKITNFLSGKITVIARSGCPPSRWGSGLQVMLEKCRCRTRE